MKIQTLNDNELLEIVGGLEIGLKVPDKTVDINDSATAGVLNALGNVLTKGNHAIANISSVEGIAPGTINFLLATVPGFFDAGSNGAPGPR